MHEASKESLEGEEACLLAAFITMISPACSQADLGTIDHEIFVPALSSAAMWLCINHEYLDEQ